MAATVPCTHCPASLTVEVPSSDYRDCPQCGVSQRVFAFPALLAGPRTGTFGEAVTVSDESTCYYHPEKKAVVVCDGCGRFLCSLCDLDMSGKHICASCLEAGRGMEKEKLERSRFLYEELAISAALLAFLLPFLSIPLGFYAVYVGLRHWNKPGKFGGRPKLKKAFAIVIGGGVAIGWSAVFAFAFWGNGG